MNLCSVVVFGNSMNGSDLWYSISVILKAMIITTISRHFLSRDSRNYANIIQKTTFCKLLIITPVIIMLLFILIIISSFICITAQAIILSIKIWTWHQPNIGILRSTYFIPNLTLFYEKLKLFFWKFYFKDCFNIFQLS